MELPLELDGQGLPPLGMPPERFLRDYWQRRPLLIRQAFADFQSPISGDDLAALSLREEALSRLVLHDRKRRRWVLENGPFEDDRFEHVPERDWSLLVQDLDKWDPEVGALLAHFEFLPRWRIDDIMVSFAAPGGSVGAHVDQYDVFLLQAAGQRRWAIDARPAPDLSLDPKAPLKLLRQFEPSHEWVLRPGDMLYLPPGVPHHGVAVDACLTFSIGMRAPSLKELLLAWVHEAAETLDETQRHSDPGLRPAIDPTALAAEAVAALAASLRRGLDDMAAAPLPADEFMGRFLSNYRSPRQAQPRPRKLGAATLAARLQRGARLQPDRWLRWLHAGQQPCRLYVAGLSVSLPLTLARRLCRFESLDWQDWQALDDAARNELLTLVNASALGLTR
jgi:50S ribosomal protein L16 3-hydroxylase